jgi:adenine-specific DNA-methyltransferase
MAKDNDMMPMHNESPSRYADRLGVHYSGTINQDHKKSHGQFFTPNAIAALMGQFAECRQAQLRILDPGCGTAILTCSLIESLLQRGQIIESLSLVAYETDKRLTPYTRMTLDYLKIWLAKYNVSFEFDLRTVDFVLDQAHCLNDEGSLFDKSIELFDLVISNPPYFKLSIDDKRAIAAKSIINGHPNIYSTFMAIAAKVLKPNGQLIFITPRSYASGSYFKLFREFFFRIVEIDRVHLFVSRKDTFVRDKVLQETVIIKGRRVPTVNPNHQVVVQASHGLRDIDSPVKKVFLQKDLIDIHSNEKILYLPTTDADESVLDIVRRWNGTLSNYNIHVSTGPVVAYRAWDFITDGSEDDRSMLAPLFWLHNVRPMALEWPIAKPEKGQYIQIHHETRSILIPNKNYVLLRRFSSKDDKSRLIAAPYFSHYLHVPFIGVENKVNYIYRKGGHLDRNEVVGLCALLNSQLFDTYFRIFNGNVNVSATELREMRLPDLAEIRMIGERIILSNDFSTEHANTIISECFNFENQIVQ